MTTSPLRLLIAEDHPIYQKGLVSALQSLSFIGQITTTSNGLEAIRLMDEEPFPCVLMDIRMPGADGIHTAKTILQLHPETRIILLSTYDDEDLIQAAKEIGVSGYLLKSADREEIIRAIMDVMAGGYHYSPEINHKLQRIEEEEKFIAQTEGASKLSRPLFREVIYLICQELTSKEIGELIFASPRTVEAYRAQILKLTSSRTGVGIQRYAMRRGILDDAELKEKFKNRLEKLKAQ